MSPKFFQQAGEQDDSLCCFPMQYAYRGFQRHDARCQDVRFVGVYPVGRRVVGLGEFGRDISGEKKETFWIALSSPPRKLEWI